MFFIKKMLSVVLIAGLLHMNLATAGMSLEHEVIINIDSVEQAKAAILQDQDFVQALNLLDAELSVNPNNQKALFWRSVLILATNEDLIALLQQVGVLDQNKQIVGISNLQLPSSANTNEVQSLLTGTTVQFDEAFNQLDSIDINFSDSITVNGETIDLDYADVKVLEMFYAFLNGLAQIYKAYNMADIDVDVLNPPSGTIEQFLTNHPDLFGPNGDGQAALSSAQAAFIKLLDCYVLASAHIRSRNDGDPRNFMIRFYPPYDPLMYPNLAAWQEERDQILDQEERARNFLTEIKNNLLGLNNVIENPLTQEERLANKRANPINGGINLYPIFQFPSDFRNFLINLSNQGSEKGFMLENFFDPSFGGVVVNTDPQDFNYLSGKGADFVSAFTTTAINWDDVDLLGQTSDSPTGGISIVANGTSNNAVKINWFISKLQHLEGSALYRDTQPNVTQQSTFIGFVPANGGVQFNPAFFSLTDTQIPASGKYYYRIFNTYNWGAGRVGKTYSDVASVDFVKTDVNQPPVLNFIPDVSTHKTSIVEFTVSASDTPGQPLTMWAELESGFTPPYVGASFTDLGNGTGTFRWVLTNKPEGPTKFRFVVSDGEYTDSQFMTINVTATNPIITPVSDKVVHVGETLTFNVLAFDPDGDPLSWSAEYEHLPVSFLGATFVDNGNGTGTFTWTPTANHANQPFLIQFLLRDPDFAGGDNVDIQVLPVPVDEGIVISGRVVDQNGQGVSGITMMFQNGGLYPDKSRAKVVTDQDGNYKFVHVETLFHIASRIKSCTKVGLCRPVSGIVRHGPNARFEIKDSLTGKNQIDVDIDPLNLVDHSGLNFVMKPRR